MPCPKVILYTLLGGRGGGGGGGKDDVGQTHPGTLLTGARPLVFFFLGSWGCFFFGEYPFNLK